MNLLLFRVGSRVLTLPTDLIRQVRALDTLSPLPGSGGALLGLTVVAGRAVPVLNLRQLLGMPAAEVPARLLLVSLQEQLFCLPVDDVLGFAEDEPPPGSDLLSPESVIGLPSAGQRGQHLSPDALLAALNRRLTPA
ncbi:chemotaxis protein CheW [Deinococcus sp. VB142]|uniref:Chemotaxis protein CheW n=1 Tax=Deinococcus sp. VB142 TaxID=3112952 RepID=A0AAU6Q6J3_9DEIO